MNSSLPPISEDDLYAALQGDPRLAGLAAGARASQPLPAPSPHHISIDEVLAMLDQQDALDGGSPALGNPGAMPMMGSPPPVPGMVHEPAAQVPAPSGGAGYLRRLGLQFAAHPLEYRTPPRGRASDPERFLMSLLANSANALGTRATQGKAEEDALNLDLRTQAAERNKANAKATQDYRDSLIQGGRDTRLNAMKNAGELSKDQREAEQKRLDRLAEIEKARIMASGRGGGAGSKTDPATWGDLASVAEMVANGEADLTSYPIYMRKPISDYMDLNGMRITPKKVRDANQTLNAARAVIDQLETMALGDKNVKGDQGVIRSTNAFSRPFRGAATVVGALSQANEPAAEYSRTREGFLALLSRAAGERGVLTDQDVARAKKLLPGLTDTRGLTERQFKRLRTLFDEIQARTLKTYTTAAGARAQEAPPAAGLKPAADGSFDFVPGAR